MQLRWGPASTASGPRLPAIELPSRLGWVLLNKHCVPMGARGCARLLVACEKCIFCSLLSRALQHSVDKRYILPGIVKEVFYFPKDERTYSIRLGSWGLQMSFWVEGSFLYQQLEQDRLGTVESNSLAFGPEWVEKYFIMSGVWESPRRRRQFYVSLSQRTAWYFPTLPRWGDLITFSFP